MTRRDCFARWDRPPVVLEPTGVFCTNDRTLVVIALDDARGVQPSHASAAAGYPRGDCVGLPRWLLEALFNVEGSVA